MTDRELFLAYRREGTAEVFAQLVGRHVDLVYSVARRHVGDAHSAEDVTQEVFLTLARKARGLEAEVPVAGWLFTTTRLLSLQALRGEGRRKRRETEAAVRQDRAGGEDPTWGLIAEDVDKAVAELPAKERDAVVLRFFSGKTHPEIAAMLAISEEAAKKRVQRGLEALQELLVRRGIVASAVTVAALAGALSSHAVKAAPAGMAGSVTSGIAAKGFSGAGIVKGAVMGAKVKAGFIGAAAVAVIVGSAGTAIYLSNKTVAGKPAGGTPVAASEPAATGASPDYLGAYALPAGRVIANFPDVDPAVRQAALEQLAGRKIPGKPGFMQLEWTDNKLSWATVTTGGPAAGPVPLDKIFGIDGPEVASALLVPEFRGDIVFRTGATEGEYLKSLGEMVSEQLQRPIRCDIHQQVMDVVVLKGSYHFALPSDDTPGDHPAQAIALYVSRIEGENWSFGSSEKFAAALGERIGKPVVVDCADFPKQASWVLSKDCSMLIDPADVETVLTHVSAETGLSVSREERSMRCLFVENAADHVSVAAWKDDRRVSPFAGVRWNGELPEVEVEETWYGLMGAGKYSVERLVAFAKESAKTDWKMRFEEDFVAMLGLMGVDGVAERNVASLWLKDLSTGKVRMREVGMTEGNRRAIVEGRRAK